MQLVSSGAHRRNEACYGAVFIILMGVAGTGKTTVGRLLAKELGWRFYEGDDFHPPANVEKMRCGEPLTDRDRRPWLDALRAAIQGALKKNDNGINDNGIMACSALKRSYRGRLRVSEQVVFAYLAAAPDVIRRRLEERTGHFMNPSLLESQFAALETPQDALTLDAAAPPAVLVQQLRQELSI